MEHGAGHIAQCVQRAAAQPVGVGAEEADLPIRGVAGLGTWGCRPGQVGLQGWARWLQPGYEGLQPACMELWCQDVSVSVSVSGPRRRTECRLSARRTAWSSAKSGT